MHKFTTTSLDASLDKLAPHKIANSNDAEIYENTLFKLRAFQTKAEIAGNTMVLVIDDNSDHRRLMSLVISAALSDSKFNIDMACIDFEDKQNDNMPKVTYLEVNDFFYLAFLEWLKNVNTKLVVFCDYGLGDSGTASTFIKSTQGLIQEQNKSGIKIVLSSAQTDIGINDLINIIGGQKNVIQKPLNFEIAMGKIVDIFNNLV